jgi:hypothetical protein
VITQINFKKFCGYLWYFQFASHGKVCVKFFSLLYLFFLKECAITFLNLSLHRTTRHHLQIAWGRWGTFGLGCWGGFGDGSVTEQKQTLGTKVSSQIPSLFINRHHFLRFQDIKIDQKLSRRLFLQTTLFPEWKKS